MTVRCSAEVADALAAGRPVVALESTLLAHGLPAPRNRDVARRLETAVRSNGAVPVTIAVLDGHPVIGLSDAELDRLCDPAEPFAKLSHRDLAVAAARGTSGATTVASTTTIAHAAGVEVFATGGIGGVHRGASSSFDVSADLQVLARVPVLVVCAGVKSILDVAATLEVLETASVPVIGFRSPTFPAFYLRDSGLELPWTADDPSELAAIAAAHWAGAGPTSGVVVANPIAAEDELDRALHDRVLTDGLAELGAAGIRGKDVTPALLAYFHEHTHGASLGANEALVLGNATLAAEIAAALASSRAAGGAGG